MKPMEIKRKEAEFNRVTAARLDMEIAIDDMEQKIARLRKDIDIQLEKEKDLADQIKKMKEMTNE